jgi:hypothetical protein
MCGTVQTVPGFRINIVLLGWPEGEQAFAGTTSRSQVTESFVFKFIGRI